MALPIKNIVIALLLVSIVAVLLTNKRDPEIFYVERPAPAAERVIVRVRVPVPVLVPVVVPDTKEEPEAARAHRTEEATSADNAHKSKPASAAAVWSKPENTGEELNTDMDTLGKDSTQENSNEPLRCTTHWQRSVPSDSVDRHPLGEPYRDKGCDPQQKISCTGSKKGRRALLIYMLHSKGAFEIQPAMRNFNYFLRYGVYGPNQSSAMFESVDYVFFRHVPGHLPQVNQVTVAAEEANVKLMWVPNGPCDLCAHSRVIEFLGGAKALAAKYTYFVYANSGTRGPFQHADDAHWIDIFAMGGRTYWDSSAKSQKTMTGISISMEQYVHVQSMFVGIETGDGQLERFMPFMSCCGKGVNCVAQCEVGSGRGWLNLGGALHTLSLNYTVKNFNDIDRLVHHLAVTRFGPHGYNPFMGRLDTCNGVFSKHGGNFEVAIMEIVAGQATHLDVHQPENRLLQGRHVVKRLLKQCQFLGFNN